MAPPKKKLLQSGVWEKENLDEFDARSRNGRTARQRRNDASPGRVREWGRGGVGRRRRRRRVKMSSDVAAVMKREANDWRQEVGEEGKG